MPVLGALLRVGTIRPAGVSFHWPLRRSVEHWAAVRLIIVHHHFRPGGVRRVIEQATPALVQSPGARFDAVTLVAGEPPPAAWVSALAARVAPVELTCHIEPACGYLSDQRGSPPRIRRRLRRTLDALLRHDGVPAPVVWVHNPALGRNPLLLEALSSTCAHRGATLVCHHHDWWFDNRWPRWPELRRCGFPTLTTVARATFPSGAGIRHAAINRADAAHLTRALGRRAAWLPNLVERERAPARSERRRVLAWSRRQFGDDRPVWLMPCRLLRRKNIAEALLLTRWLRPDAWLVTTAAPSSNDEAPYAQALATAAQHHGWRLRLAALADTPEPPSIRALFDASEAILLTSILEGFGLPCLEAAASGRPLLTRRLLNVTPDLEALGFRLPYQYDELRIPTALFDRDAEVRRQTVRFARWKSTLPRTVHRWVEPPELLQRAAPPKGVAFSRLTLVAQLEVLAQPIDRSWQAALPLNPWLSDWHRDARDGRLRPTPWPAAAAARLDGAAYARRFHRLLRAPSRRDPPLTPPRRILERFLAERLDGAHHFPLLWNPAP